MYTGEIYFWKPHPIPYIGGLGWYIGADEDAFDQDWSGDEICLGFLTDDHWSFIYALLQRIKY